MDFVRMSVPPMNEDSESNSSYDKLKEPQFGEHDTVRSALVKKCLDILPLIVDSKFQSKYWTLMAGPYRIPDCYVFSHRSSRCLVLEVVTWFPQNQIENLHTYKFTAHPQFEAILNINTKFKRCEKPNLNLLRSRSWDVALNVVMKIEAVPVPFDSSRYLLKREHLILEHLWERYVDKNIDIDEMTGIPMVFDYAEVPNDTFYAMAEGRQITEIDIYGKTKQLKFKLTGSHKRSTLTYMTMEKLGPSLRYLQQMTRATQRPPLTFDLWSALKIFDQLLCRILQLHRFGVVHNDICPENIYMGNGVAVNVMYLSNFKRSYVIVENDKEGPNGLASSCVGCNLRFASVGQLSGSPRLMRPIDDVECAFYTLMSMLNADALPWDILLRVKRNSENSHWGAKHSSTLIAGVHNPNDDLRTQFKQPSRITTETETIRKIMELKLQFWNSTKILKMVKSNVACVFSYDQVQAAAVTSVLNDIYFRVRDWREQFKPHEESMQYCRKLWTQTSEEYRQLMELRKCALIYFRFSEISDTINDITFRKKVHNQLTNHLLQQQPWNDLVWCFGNIEMKPQAESKSQSGRLKQSFAVNRDIHTGHYRPNPFTD